MSEANHLEISVDDILKRIARKVSASKQGNMSVLDFESANPSLPINMEQPFFQFSPLKLPRYPEDPPFEQKPVYVLADFLNHHDESFVRNAYRGILERDPDAQGFLHFLTKLRSGKLSKVDIVGRLRYSAEGRHKAKRIKGLAPLFALSTAYRIPFVGYLFRFFVTLLHLPTVVQNIQQFEAYVHWRFTQLQQIFNHELESIENFLNTLNNHFGSSFQQLADSKADEAIVKTLQEQSATLLRDKADQEAALITLHQQLEAGLGVKADTEVLERLQDLVGRLSQSRLNQEQLLAVVQSQVEGLAQAKADMPALLALQEQLTQLAQAKADMPALLALQEQLTQLTQLAQVKADVSALLALQEQLTQLVQTAVSGEILTGLQQQLAALGQNKADYASLQKQELELKSINRQLLNQRRNITDQQRRLSILLMEARRGVANSPTNIKQAEALANEQNHLLDAMYASFEDIFRGTREDIKQRQQIYLPYLQSLGSRPEDISVLDIGCGRGEWMELLKENGFNARGIDINRVLIQECRALGLDVVESDAIDYLRQQTANTLEAITGFHMIEHISLDQLIALFDEALRVLKPNGMVIFETPNPENIIVGACNFYSDPTHRNPLFPDTIKFIAEQRGFNNLEILRLHKLKEPIYTGQEFVDEIIWRFNMEQDYSIVGYKA